jgi:acyl-CoA thioester hydrolase
MLSPVFEHRLRVRYHETDQQGIVYHARYLEYLDVAMTEYFRHLGWDYKRLVKEGCDPSIVRTTVNFVRPASFEDQISIRVRPVRVGNSSFTLSYEITNGQDGEPLLVAETVYVNFDAATRRSIPLPSSVRERMSQDLVDALSEQRSGLKQAPSKPD